MIERTSFKFTKEKKYISIGSKKVKRRDVITLKNRFEGNYYIIDI